MGCRALPYRLRVPVCRWAQAPRSGGSVAQLPRDAWLPVARLADRVLGHGGADSDAL
jgi:hypothetical protein